MPLLCVNSGTEMPGIPVKLANTVKMSARYMATGSLFLCPISKAVVGLVANYHDELQLPVDK